MKARILLVARDDDVCDAISGVLGDEGASVLRARHPDDALAELRRGAVEVAIVEAVPPDLSHFQNVRDEATRLGVPWIALSSGRTPAGSPYVLMMPGSEGELLSLVEAALSRREP